MRPREREDDEDAPPPESSPALPPRRAGGGLSSMVVRPPESSGGEDAEEPRHPEDDRLRDSSPQQRRRDSLPPARRRVSPQDQRRRDFSPGIRRRDSPPPFRRRGSPLDIRRRGGSPGFHSRYGRFHDGPGSVSPPRRQRLDGHYDPDFDSSIGQRFGRGLRGGRTGGRFREVSPIMGHGRGRRSLGRGYNTSKWPVAEGEYIHRNDPNLSPREGDWICQNPSCGNLNFARRTQCNNCNKYRYGPELHGPVRSPRRGYIKSPRGSPPRIFGLSDRVLRDDLDRYRSPPPRGWGVEDPRNFGPRSPPPTRGGKFADNMRRGRPDYHNQLEYRQRRKFDWSAPEWDDRDNNPDGLLSRRRDYDRHALSPRGRWISRERSRSPLGNRPARGAFLGRGRGDPFLGHRRTDNLSMAHGRGYRQADSFTGRGNIDRRGIARGRDDHIY
ncbi:hypothetical protein Cni_G18070 [Canna indica]|uniref:RanBP2-type domain-containing protein n=1 Tax=Canna indica TaxID=4628 RepID=A0AAQ3KNQ7_9LILI|nr:hypothetical protein Cni_G18070 [Canna indica]